MNHNQNEQSVASMSKSAQSMSTQGREEVLKGQASIIDSLFPLIHTMSQRVSFPSVLLGMFSIYLLLQTSLVSLWVYSPSYLTLSDTAFNIYSVVVKFLMFHEPNDVYLKLRKSVHFQVSFLIRLQ